MIPLPISSILLFLLGLKWLNILLSYVSLKTQKRFLFMLNYLPSSPNMIPCNGIW